MASTYTILLVDDDEDFLELLVECFTDCGIPAIGVSTPLEALQAASGTCCDVAVIDRKLRGHDGLGPIVEGLNGAKDSLLQQAADAFRIER